MSSVNFLICILCCCCCCRFLTYFTSVSEWIYLWPRSALHSFKPRPLHRLVILYNRAVAGSTISIGDILLRRTVHSGSRIEPSSLGHILLFTKGHHSVLKLILRTPSFLSELQTPLESIFTTHPTTYFPPTPNSTRTLPSIRKPDQRLDLLPSVSPVCPLSCITI